MNFFERILFPWDACCIGCRNEKVYKYGFCETCFTELSDIEDERCPICLDRVNTKGLCSACLKERPDYEKLYSAKVYEGNLKKLLHLFKYHNARYLKHPFALLMLDSVPEDILYSITAIVPVASNKDRIKTYGYNQALILANEFSRVTGKKVLSVLRKHPSKTNMHMLNKAERRKNIKGLYYVEGSLKGETVLLLDDICTTGETLRSCAHLLKKAGAEKVYAITVARDDIKN